MRLSGALTLAPLVCLAACSSSTSPGPAPTSSATTDTAPPAPPSPFAVALEAKAAIAFTGLTGGVAAATNQCTKWALATDGTDLKSMPMPSGLPDADEGHILRFAGKAPGPVWLSFVFEGEDKKTIKHPLYRLDTKKNEWKRFAEDWRPLLATWTKNRILAASTSSGKLKVKVMEPYAKVAPPDLPSSHLDDEACEKGLRVEGLATATSGAVFMAGNCKPGSASGKRYVLLQWSPPTDAPAASGSASARAPAPSARASAAPAASGSASAPAANPEPEDAGAPEPEDGGTGDAGAPEEPKGPPGKVIALPGVNANLAHRSLLVRSDSDVWLLGEDEGAKKSHLYHFDGSKVEEVDLPAMEGPAKAASITGAGVLWLIGNSTIWQRAEGGAWQSVPPPNAAYPEGEPRWEMLDVWAVGQGDVWISAKHASKVAERYLLLRLMAPKELLRWQ